MFSLCDLRGALHLPPHPHHREQLQQVLREGQDWGGDRRQEEESLVGGCQKRCSFKETASQDCLPLVLIQIQVISFYLKLKN